MRKLIFPLVLLAVSGSALAGERPPLAAQAGVLVGGVLGAVLGGPPGAIAGAALGGFAAERSHEAGKVEGLVADNEAIGAERTALAAEHGRLQAELLAARQSLELERSLASEQASTAALAHGLAFNVPFATDSATPPEGSDTGLAALAALMNAVPELEIHVEGFADPRGGPKHNLELSEARARAVAERLVAAGVDAARVHAAGRGALPEAGIEGLPDTDAWALQRRASVRVLLNEDRLAARP